MPPKKNKNQYKPKNAPAEDGKTEDETADTTKAGKPIFLLCRS